VGKIYQLKDIMRLLVILALALCFCSYQLLGQGDSDGVKYQFAKDVFKTEYKRQDFSRFNGNIDRISEDVFRFGDKVLTLNLEDKSLINIFLRGIFYPDIIGGKEGR
jgi:hypothetical protein